MKLRTILAGVALGATAFVAPAAAYATEMPDNTTVAAAMFVDNCDETVDVTIVNVKNKTGAYKVNDGETFTIGADDIRTLGSVPTITRTDGTRVVLVNSYDTKMQEIEGVEQVAAGEATDAITHFWRKAAGCETTTPIPTPTLTEPGVPTPTLTEPGVPTPSATETTPASPAPSTSSVPAPIQVVPVANTGGGQGSLPVTGSGMTYVYVAFALLVAGLALVAVTRFRRSRNTL